ncbi:XRE family transcriptional regulator [Spectribacter hydrogenoxidans]|uniref:XRE family transcriptional regulator n=1 Tax=Spectribacter hydrogenoxidans TaxID=3075608 RepID=A0ABU3BWG4_9GAMM|nr:XRE family transcriptional regulator [Salinisphaera sp. W335]MDT0633648.1 XRE family transcriptional regulator [Salinisphaera sp. W335]
MIGARIKQARVAAGLSLRGLADGVGLSAMAISKYEREETKPSSEVLLRLSKALGVRVEYFFRQVEVELEGIEYRKHPQLPKRDEQRVLADVVEQLERWVELESIIPSSWPKAFEVPARLPEKIETMDAIEACAKQVREAWNLGLDPIGDLIEEMEEEGINVVLIDYDAEKRFDGLSSRVRGAPVIVVGREWPGDRQRFTLAHELGHLVLRGRLAGDAAKKGEEKACDRFAGAFLVPREEVFRALGERRKWLEPRELYLLKHEWGLSMNAWLYRAKDLGIVNGATAGRLWRFFAAHGWRKNEPGDAYPNERTERFDQLVYRALAEDLIGEAKAAELLGLKIAELRARRRMESGDEADRH